MSKVMARVKRLKALPEDAEKARDEGEAELLLELGGSLNNPKTSDVIFTCKDGKDLHASRWLLSLRSPWFKAMFDSNMVESKAAKVPLPQFPSTTLLAVLEYLYTGAIRSCPILTWTMGFELVSAGHFFRIPGLEGIAQEYLWRKVSHVTKHLRSDIVMEMLSLALEFQEDWDEKDKLLDNLMDGLCTDWYLEESHLQKLSEKAVDYILTKRRGNGNARRERASVEEYYTFREIVLWHIIQQLPELSSEITEKLQKTLPIEEDETLLWSTVSRLQLNIDDSVFDVPSITSVPHSQVLDPTAVLNTIFGIDIPNDSFQRLLTHVDWSRMPAMLLLKVLCPLKVVPLPALFKAFALNVLHGPVEPLVYGPYKWKSTGPLACGLDGLVCCKSKDGARSVCGRAISSLPIVFESHGIYKWQFEFRENDSNFIELGIVGGSSRNAYKDHHLDQEMVWYGPAARVLWLYSRQGISTVGFKKLKSQDMKSSDAFWVKQKEDSVVKFRLDAAEKSCHVSFGRFSATLWKDLSDAVYHPVIAVNDGNRVIARLKAVSGFD